MGHIATDHSIQCKMLVKRILPASRLGRKTHASGVKNSSSTSTSRARGHTTTLLPVKDRAGTRTCKRLDNTGSKRVGQACQRLFYGLFSPRVRLICTANGALSLGDDNG